MLNFVLFYIFPAVHCLSGFRAFGPQAVNLWRLDQRSRLTPAAHVLAVDPSPVVQRTFTQPLDHFDRRIAATFQQRYWINPHFYKPGGPVIILDGGEGPGDDFLPPLRTGIVAKLASATGGLCLLLEHRYYGESIPVPNFSTDSLRWLTNEQAVADSANFMKNVDFSSIAGINADLTAPGTPWVYYGGSYAGARSAHMRALHPDLVYGAIASGAVTHASISLWQYYDVVRAAAPEACSSALVKAVETINLALSRPDLNAPLKRLFGLEGLADDDFSGAIATPLGSWEKGHWHPDESDDEFKLFCESIVLKPSDPSKQIGHIGDLTVDYGLLNYANYIQKHVVAPCCLPNDWTIHDCFSTTDDSNYQLDDLSETWRLWHFQVCTTWGFLFDAPPLDVPPMVARPLTAKYLLKICKQAFPPGEFFAVPKAPNVNSVNILGGYHIAADRLAIIDGELDPWRPATPHSAHANLLPRPDTTLRPFKLIPNAVHVWDLAGLVNIADEPPQIQAIHKEEIAFVKAWLKDWKSPRPRP